MLVANSFNSKLSLKEMACLENGCRAVEIGCRVEPPDVFSSWQRIIVTVHTGVNIGAHGHRWLPGIRAALKPTCSPRVEGIKVSTQHLARPTGTEALMDAIFQPSACISAKIALGEDFQLFRCLKMKVSSHLREFQLLQFICLKKNCFTVILYLYLVLGDLRSLKITEPLLSNSSGYVVIYNMVELEHCFYAFRN